MKLPCELASLPAIKKEAYKLTFFVLLSRPILIQVANYQQTIGGHLHIHYVVRLQGCSGGWKWQAIEIAGAKLVAVDITAKQLLTRGVR